MCSVASSLLGSREYFCGILWRCLFVIVKNIKTGVQIEVWSLCFFWVLWSFAVCTEAGFWYCYAAVVERSLSQRKRIVLQRWNLEKHTMYHDHFKNMYLYSVHCFTQRLTWKYLNMVDSFEHWIIRDIVDLFHSCFWGMPGELYSLKPGEVSRKRKIHSCFFRRHTVFFEDSGQK